MVRYSFLVGLFHPRLHAGLSRRLRSLTVAVLFRAARCVSEPRAIATVGEWLRSVLSGYYQYHAVRGNLAVLSRFRHQVARLWYRTLGQRSQRRPTWKKLSPIFDHWLPIPHVVHAYPDARFDARRLVASHPR
jgi:hypothetical protein